MRVVVADTSPLNYLILIGHIEVLREMDETVLVPPEVLAELAATGAPAQVSEWLRAKPHWLQARAVRLSVDDPTLMNIGEGERAAILLAQEEADVLLLIDDAAGRAEANRRRIANTGTLGVLREAALRDLLDLRTALNHLAKTNFRASASLLEQILRQGSGKLP
jgi:predicted nucleic acid-binding protein